MCDVWGGWYEWFDIRFLSEGYRFDFCVKYWLFGGENEKKKEKVDNWIGLSIFWSFVNIVVGCV